MGGWLDFVYQQGFQQVLAQTAKDTPPIDHDALAHHATIKHAEAAGVDAAAAQHAALNFFIIILVLLALFGLI
jgi:hypothetical protein